MTYKEAIEQLKWLNCLQLSPSKNEDALNIAIKALERLTYKPKLQPCICGCKRPHRVYMRIGNEYQAIYSCPKCDRISAPAKSQRGLVRAWNEMIEKESKMIMREEEQK